MDVQATGVKRAAYGGQHRRYGKGDQLVSLNIDPQTPAPFGSSLMAAVIAQPAFFDGIGDRDGEQEHGHDDIVVRIFEDGTQSF